MKKCVFSLPIKFLAILLAILCIFSAIVSGFGVFCLLMQDGYYYSYNKMQQRILEVQYGHLCHSIAYIYHENFHDSNEAIEANLFHLKDAAVDFNCTVSSLRDVLYSDVNESSSQEYVAAFSERIYIESDSIYEQESVYDITVYLKEPAPGSGLDTKLEILEIFYSMRYSLIWIFSSCTLGAILLLIYLSFAAGRWGENPPKLRLFDKIPLEFYILGGVLAFFLEIGFIDIAPSQIWFCLIAAVLFILADAALVVLFFMTLAARIKTKCFFETTLVGKIWFLAKKYAHLFRRFWEDMRLVPKLVLILGATALFDLILADVIFYIQFYVVLLIEGLCLAGFLIWYGASLQHLKQDQEILADGKLDHRCDTQRLPYGLRSLGDAMNRSAEGMEKAVEEKIKSERFKTELITNVSHDIKTPLTSIINYVDLIKKEEIENEKIKEYVEVLERHSARLKKLTEDLVESSKAASGILPMEIIRCDVGVLLEQALGEYQSAFEEKGLIPCFSLPEESVYILADGKRLWRVMDNLLRNIEKYALSGTRVYVNLEEKDGKVQIIFRNISAQPIPVSGEYLSERFVRGDLSRNTEGSGLGLAIAKSLVELQKGSLTVTVDGDLFKAVIEFYSDQER